MQRDHTPITFRISRFEILWGAVTAALIYAMNRLDAPGWVWCVAGAIWSGICIGAVSVNWNRKTTAMLDYHLPTKCSRCHRDFARSPQGWLQLHPSDCAEIMLREQQEKP